MPSDVDRLKSGLVSIIRRTLGAKIINRVDYLAFYPCRVIGQNADGSLDLIADDERVGTFVSVPIRYGVPGISVTVPSGSRCYITFGGGDPSKPIVVGWETGTVLSIIIAGGTKGAARKDDLVVANTSMALWIGQVSSTLAIGTPTDFGKISGFSAKVTIG